jgi:hypothetical protein
MPTKNSKYKPVKNETPKRKITGAQIVFGIFAVLLILSMVLSMISTNL